jgi:tetratricopeptide (TPR) repeat protein
VAPEEEARGLLEKAAEAFAAVDTAGCIASCDRILESFEGLAGTRLEERPHVRNRELLSKGEVKILFEPYAFPLAQTWALRARALVAAGDEAEALRSWVSAYARARQSLDEEERAVSPPALIEIGMRFLKTQELDRALLTFQKFLRSHPGHEQKDRAWFGLGKVFWCQGRFHLAENALARVAASPTLPQEQRDDARWYLDRCRLFAPRMEMNRPAGSLFVADVDGDGGDEILLLSPRGELTVNRVGTDGLRPLCTVPWKSWNLDVDITDYHIYEAVWTELHGKGKGALSLAIEDGKGWSFVLLPLSLDGPCGPALHFPLPGRMSVSYADLDGDGHKEVVRREHGPSMPMDFFRIREGALEPLGRIQLSSYFLSGMTADLDGDGAEEYLAFLNEWKDWQGIEVRFHGGERPLVRRSLSPFRFAGRLLDVVRDRGKVTGILMQTCLYWEHRRVLQQKTEARHVLDDGLYLLKPHEDTPPRPLSAAFPAATFSHLGTYHEGAETALLYCALEGDAWGLGFRPVDRSKMWALSPLSPQEHFVDLHCGRFDDDAPREVILQFRDKFRVLGMGRPRPVNEDDLLGRDPEAETLLRLKNLTLATAIEMAALGWKEQALVLFEKARTMDLNPFEARRAALGLADCLVKSGREEEAVALYDTLLSSSTVGIAEEFTALVNLLRRRGDWRGMERVLAETLERITLPEETASWARELKGKVDPLTRLDHKVALVPFPPFDKSFVCDDPLKVRGPREGEPLRFFSDGARRSFFGRWMDYNGSPLVLEARVVIERMDWTAFLILGLFRAAVGNDSTYTPDNLSVLVTPGRCTNEPSVLVSLFHGVVEKGDTHTLQVYPPVLPAEYVLRLVYAPTLDTLTFSVLEPKSGKKWKTLLPVISPLPMGKYLLAAVGSQEVMDARYRGRFALEHVHLSTPHKANRPVAWEAAPKRFTLLHAGAALAMGDLDRAVELAREADPEGPPPLGPPLAMSLFPSQGEDPSPACLASLIQAFAHLRRGSERRFRDHLAEALKADPGYGIWFLNRAIFALPEEERALLGLHLRRRLLENDGELALRAARQLGTEVQRRFRYLNEAGTAPFLDFARRLEGARGADLLRHIQEFLGFFCHPELVEAIFKGTPLQRQTRFIRLLREAQNLENAGWIEKARGVYETFLREFPNEAYAQAYTARFLSRHASVRDPGRALALANRAVAAARHPRSPLLRQLPLFLDIQADALANTGKLAEAVAALEEALRLLPAQDKPTRLRYRNKIDHLKSLRGR